MSTTYGATGLGQTAASTQRVSSFFKRYWWRFKNGANRPRLRATLCDLSDRELMDIGTTRGEIELCRLETRYRPARHPIRRMKHPISGNGGWPEVDTVRRTRSGRPGSKGGVAERRETFWRPRDLVSHPVRLQMP